MAKKTFEKEIPIDSREAYERQELRRKARPDDRDEENIDDSLEDGFAMMSDDDIDDGDIASKFDSRY